MTARILARRLTNNLRSSPFTAMVTGKNTVILNNSAAPLAKISPQNLTNFSPFRPKLLHRNPNLFPFQTLRNFSTENHDEGNRKNRDLKRDETDSPSVDEAERAVESLAEETRREMVKILREMDTASRALGVLFAVNFSLAQLGKYYPTSPITQFSLLMTFSQFYPLVYLITFRRFMRPMHDSMTLEGESKLQMLAKSLLVFKTLNKFFDRFGRDTNAFLTAIVLAMAYNLFRSW